LRSWRVLAANARHGLPQHDPEKWTSVFQPKDEGGLRLLDAADLELVESAGRFYPAEDLLDPLADALADRRPN